MGEAFRLAGEIMGAENERIRALRDHLLAGLTTIPEVRVNGHLEARVPHNLNISFQFVEGESLLMGMKGIAVSSGSACTSASLEPSYVLRALGLSDEVAHSSVRFSVGRFTTLEEIDRAVAQVKATVERLRTLSPLWDMHQAGIDIASIAWAEH
jgi:cysteine desulfurase